MNSLGATGGFVGPYLIGVLADDGRGYGLAMFVLGVLLVASAALTWLVKEDGGAAGDGGGYARGAGGQEADTTAVMYVPCGRRQSLAWTPPRTMRLIWAATTLAARGANNCDVPALPPPQRGHGGGCVV